MPLNLKSEKTPVGAAGAGRFRLVRAVFVRCIALIYLIAFLSINSQMLPLYGQHGISPVDKLLGPALGQPILPLLLSYPTVFWFNCSDSFLSLVPMLGVFTSLFALSGVLCGPALALSWLFYLSIVTVGQEFMSFQWDILLLEAGFLSIFFASWRPFDFLVAIPSFLVKFKDDNEPSIILICLYRLLLFKLMFESGLVKLQSGDPTWRDLTAMTYHFETQPLPTPGGWLAQQLPEALLMASTVSVFAIEIIAPLMIFAPRKVRALAGCFLILLQMLILVTGNYCFFNLLTIALCLLLFDDRIVQIGHGAVRQLRWKASNSSDRSSVETEIDNTVRNPTIGGRIASKAGTAVVIAVVLLIGGLTLTRLLLRIDHSAVNREPLYIVASLASPWHIVSDYGLFAVMTTKRLEISVEGSMDGSIWKEYLFRYKPGPLSRAPAIVAPHQPRLDWQMWFAALGSVDENRWFVRFCSLLLSNSPEALSLIELNPFETAPPKYIRAMIYDYHMTDLPTLFQTGNWWRRAEVGEYMPAINKRLEATNRPRLFLGKTLN